MDDVVDDSGTMCPGLRAICDSFNSSLNADGVRLAREAGVLSYQDVIGNFVTAQHFIANGEDVIQGCRDWRSLVAEGKVIQSPGHKGQAVVDSSGSGFWEHPVLFKKSKQRVLPFSAVASGSEALGGRQLAKQKIDEVVDDIISIMDIEARERYFKGISEIEDEAVSMFMLRKSISGAGGHDYLRGCLNALKRLGAWLQAKYGPRHGYRCKPAIVGWFICENLVADDAEGHAASSLVSGLRFASAVLKFPIEVADCSVKFLCKAPNRMPKQAPSASVRMLHHFFSVACDTSYEMKLRGIAAAFMVMMLAALRGVDAQRSKFHYASSDGVEAAVKYFSAVAWDSKRKECMPWACPQFVFGSDAWFEPLMFVWGDHDYLFASSVRGASLRDASELVDRPATPYMIVKYLRELLKLPSISMSEADANRMRRHSFRHWIANCTRVLGFSLSDSFQGGRWKEQGVMPLRYAQEVKFLVHIRIIRKVLSKCEEALRRVPVDNWPVFGGWEFLDPDASVSVPLAVEPEEGFENEGDDRDSDDEDGDQVDIVPEPARVKVPVAPKIRSTPRVESTLPLGWKKEVQILSSGRSVPHFYGPNESYSRSLVGAWRQFHASEGKPPSVLLLPAVGDRIEVWWTRDERWLTAVVSAIEVEGSSCVSMIYEMDGEDLCHDLKAVKWRPAQVVEQVDAENERVAAEPGPSAGPSSNAQPAAAGGAPGGKKSKRESRGHFPANICGNSDCKQFKQDHGTRLCVFPTPPKRRRSVHPKD